MTRFLQAEEGLFPILVSEGKNGYKRTKRGLFHRQKIGYFSTQLSPMKEPQGLVLALCPFNNSDENMLRNLQYNRIKKIIRCSWLARIMNPKMERSGGQAVLGPMLTDKNVFHHDYYVEVWSTDRFMPFE